MKIKLKENITQRDIMMFVGLVVFLLLWTLLTFFVFLK